MANLQPVEKAAHPPFHEVAFMEPENRITNNQERGKGTKLKLYLFSRNHTFVNPKIKSKGHAVA
jgi:hypothetical protein